MPWWRGGSGRRGRAIRAWVGWVGVRRRRDMYSYQRREYQVCRVDVWGCGRNGAGVRNDRVGRTGGSASAVATWLPAGRRRGAGVAGRCSLTRPASRAAGAHQAGGAQRCLEHADGLEAHVVLGGEAHARAEHVLKHGALLGLRRAGREGGGGGGGGGTGEH